MLLRRVPLTWSMIAACLGAVFPAAVFSSPAAAEPPAVALTLTRPAAGQTGGELTENLLSLVEVAIQADKILTVVERRQIDRALEELILDRSRPDPQLQLGKLLTADFLVMLERLPAEKEEQKPWARLRVVDAKTGVIRGATVSALDEETLEETADQFSRFAEIVATAPEKPTVTVAVLPFESKGRFDRLRPLELGIRDLVSARLLELSGAASGGNAGAKDGNPLPAPGFQVVQRSNMAELLRELDLIRSGLADKDRLPAKLPPRAAAYVVRGELDERQIGKDYAVIVRGEIVETHSARVVDAFRFESSPRELETQLAGHIDHLGERFAEDAKVRPPARVRGSVEVDSLKQITLSELRRIRRFDPILRHDLFFHLPDQTRFEAAQGIEKRAPRPPSLRHLLQKSIDRLESILFILPDDAVAAFALGFCYSIHEPDIYRPQRADEMLRKAFSLGPQTRLGSLALDYLAQIDFDDRSGKPLAGQEPQARERLWFAFANKPQEDDSEAWMLLRCLGTLYQQPEQTTALADLVEKAAPFVENSQLDVRGKMGMQLQELAIQLVRQAGDQPLLKAKGLELLGNWADGDDQELAYWGRTGLASLAAVSNDFLTAAKAFEASAARIVDLSSPADRDRHDLQLIEAAALYRSAGDPQQALKLLASFQVRVPTERRDKPADLLGWHDYQIGRCHEMLAAPEKALATYLHAAQINPTIAIVSDITRRIEKLGGVPLNPHRDVTVKYFAFDPLDRRAGRFPVHLAAAGALLYVGGDQGVRAFDPAAEIWTPTSFPSQGVSCLVAGDGWLFAGTEADGLWECDLSTGEWRRVCPLDELPDPHVVCLAPHGRDLYVGLGTRSAGGLVRIDADRRLHVFAGPNAPQVAPLRLAVAKHRLLVCTAEEVFEWSLVEERWLRRDPGKLARHGPPALFVGRSTIWASGQGRELIEWQASEEKNSRFQPAWYTAENNAGNYVHYVRHGYKVEFLTEKNDEIWFGGQPWAPFVSSGLYRFHLKTGEFQKFSPADGFKARVLHNVRDGLWLKDQLWLTTHDGLCVVTPHQFAPR